jgi:hypothetical protein
VSAPNAAALNCPFDDLAGISEQGGLGTAILKYLQGPRSAEKVLVLEDLAQALTEVAPEAPAAEDGRGSNITVSVETLSTRISMLIWFTGVFSGLVVVAVIGFMASNQSGIERIDAGIGALEAKVAERIGTLEAKGEARMGSLDARMDKFYGILMDLQKGFSKMQASQEELKASLNR